MNHRSMPYAERWQTLLVSRRGGNEAARLIARAQARYGLLVKQMPSPPVEMGRDQWLQRVLPVLALYRILREEGEREATIHSLLEALLWDTFDRERRLIRLVGRLPRWMAWSFFRRLVRSQLRQFYDTGTWRWVDEQGDRVLAFDVTHCTLHQALTLQGAPSLTSVFCAMDDRLAGLLPAHIVWRRTGTLGQGDDCCDFRYEQRSPGDPPA